jgi:hypothetical protein
MNEEDVLKALHALAESDREREASAAVEVKLRSAFRKRYRTRIWPYFAIAATAAAAIVFVLYALPKPHIVPQPIQIAAVTPAPTVASVTQPTVRKAVHRKRQPREAVTEFFPLMDDALPFERGELLRVSLPASALRSVGLPVNEDRLEDTVQADVLVGEEGLARAIRFVRYVN